MKISTGRIYELSFVGLGPRTDINRLYSLAKRYSTPLEFCITYDESRIGDGDCYPSKKQLWKTISRIVDKGPTFKTSLHLCPSSTIKLLSLDNDILSLCKNFDRVQISIPSETVNIKMFRQLEVILTKIDASVFPFTLVVKYNTDNESFLHDFLLTHHEYRNSCDILFDNVVAEFHHHYCGYTADSSQLEADKNSVHYLSFHEEVILDTELNLDACERIIKNHEPNLGRIKNFWNRVIKKGA